MKTNKKKTYVPMYAGGGFFNDNKFGQILGNYGKALADSALSTFGASNVIKDSDYKGGSAKDFARGAKIVGGINAAVAPIAMNMVMPGSGKLVSGAQKTIGGFNPQDASQYNEDGSLKDPGIAQFQQGIASAGQLAGQAQGMGLFAMGGIQYANGGTGQINSEVEKQENAVSPDGQFTQFNGASHSNGGIKTDMAPGTRIFSDKLKMPGTNKTFAKLNASNNTNREDKLFTKGNLDPKSEASLKLNMMAKMKNSDMLFAMQEQLKKDKVAAYAKKMGVQLPSMDDEQMEPQGLPEQAEGEMPMVRYGGMMNKMAMGGVQLPYYNTDNAGNPTYAMGGQYPAMTNPYHNFKGEVPMYPGGGKVTLTKPEYEQAQKDSMTLHKSGLKYPTIGKQGMDPVVNTAYMNLYNKGAAKPISGEFSQSYAGYDPSHPSVKFAKPTMVSYNEENFTEPTPRQEAPKPIMNPVATPKTFQYINDPKYGTYQEQWNKQFPQKAYGGYMNQYPDGGTIPPRFTYRALGVEPTRMTPIAEEDVRMMSRPNNFNYRNLDVERVRMQQPFNYRNLEVEPTRMTEFPDEEVYLANKSEAKPIAQRAPYTSGLKVYPKLSKGGYLPKYEKAGTTPNLGLIQSVKDVNRQDNKDQYKDAQFDDTLPPQQQPYGYTGTSYADEQAKLQGTPVTTGTENTTTPTSSDQQGFNWKNLAGQVGMGLVQNAGNLYNLSRYNKPEIEKYERMQSEKVDPTAAIRDAKLQKKAAEYNLKQGGGSAAAYMSNILGLTSLNIQDIDRIRQQYANTNAEIQNRANQYNTQLAMQEVIANAQNRARTRSGKGEAIAGIGQNVSQQMLDSKKGKMDEKTLAMYQSYFNNPQFKAAMKKAGYDLG